QYGEDVRRELLELGVLVAHIPVVEASREGDLVLRRGQVLGKVLELLYRLQLRIVLGDREDRAKGRGQHVLRLRALLGRRGRTRRDRGRASLRHVLKHRRLMGRVALDGRDEVWAEVVAPLQLDVDTLPRR